MPVNHGYNTGLAYLLDIANGTESLSEYGPPLEKGIKNNRSIMIMKITQNILDILFRTAMSKLLDKPAPSSGSLLIGLRFL